MSQAQQQGTGSQWLGSCNKKQHCRKMRRKKQNLAEVALKFSLFGG